MKDRYMKKIVSLILALSLITCLLVSCVESDGQGDTTTTPPTGESNTQGDHSTGTNDAAVDTNGDGVIDENDRVTSDTENSKPDDTTSPGSTVTPTDPATIEYAQDQRLAESIDDMIFTCMGASNTTLAGSVSIGALYEDQFPVVSIWSRAFYGCTDITDVTIAKGITHIYAEAFAYCTSMTDIYLPSTLTSIDMDAFAGCDHLTNIHFAGTRAQWAAITTGEHWQPSVDQYTLHCSDGTVVIHLK